MTTYQAAAALRSQTLLREVPAQEITVRVRKLSTPQAGSPGTPGVQLTRRR